MKSNIRDPMLTHLAPAVVGIPREVDRALAPGRVSPHDALRPRSAVEVPRDLGVRARVQAPVGASGAAAGRAGEVGGAVQVV